MTTPKEIYDYLMAKYPGKEVMVSQVFKSDNPDEPTYFTARIGELFGATNETPPDVDKMLAELEPQMPTPEQQLAAMAKASDELLGKAAEIVAQMADLEAKLKT
jgi:hypothetical protein